MDHALSEEESIVLNVHLRSAARHGELTHAYYSDFDFTGSKVRVTEKPEWDWHPKKYQERAVPIPRWLARHIAERRKTRPNATHLTLRFSASALFEMRMSGSASF